MVCRMYFLLFLPYAASTVLYDASNCGSNRLPDSLPIHSATVKDVSYCAFNCAENKQCRSFAVRSGSAEKECRLYNISIDAYGTGLLNEGGWSFHQIKSLSKLNEACSGYGPCNGKKARLVASFDEDGILLFGDNDELISLFKTGALPQVVTNNDIYTTHTSYNKGTTTLCNLIKHEASLQNGRLSAELEWKYRVICSSISDEGNQQSLNVKPPLRTSGASQSKHKTKWYIKELKDPRLLFENGNTDISQLLNAIKSGFDIPVNAASDLIQPSAVMINSDESKVAVIWHIIGRSSGFYAPTKSQHVVSFLTSDGFRKYTRVYAGEGGSPTTTNSLSISLKWYADICWGPVVSVGQDGSVTSGSIASLRNAVNQGRRVRVMISDSITLAYEPDSIYITDNGNVASQMTRLFTSDNADPLKPGDKNKIQMLNANGRLYEKHCIMEQGNCQKFSMNVAAKWFAESQTYELLYKTSDNGEVILGSYDKLVSAFHSGATFRLKIYFGSSSMFFTAAHVLKHTDPVSLIATFSDNVGSQWSADGRLMNNDDDFWSFIAVSSTGYVETKNWKFNGDPLTGSETYQLHAVDWFVAY